jgi:hypothetical protein
MSMLYHHFFRAGFVVILIMGLLIACAGGPKEKTPPPTKPDSPQTKPQEPATGQPAIEHSGISQRDGVQGEYIVTVDEGAGEEIVRQAFVSFNLVTCEDLGKGRYLVKIHPDPGPETVVRKAVSLPGIKAVQPNYTYQTQ